MVPHFYGYYQHLLSHYTGCSAHKHLLKQPNLAQIQTLFVSIFRKRFPPRTCVFQVQEIYIDCNCVGCLSAENKCLKCMLASHISFAML